MITNLFNENDQPKAVRLRGVTPCDTVDGELDRQIDLVFGEIDDRLDVGLLYWSAGCPPGLAPRAWLRDHRELVASAAEDDGISIEQVIFDDGTSDCGECLAPFSIGVTYGAHLQTLSPEARQQFIDEVLFSRFTTDPFFAAETFAFQMTSILTTGGFSGPEASVIVIQRFVDLVGELDMCAGERCVS